MRFVVYGAGAVGGSLGALLSVAGYDVTLIARGEHLKALRSTGLHVGTPEKETRYVIPAVGGAGEVDRRPGDVVLLAMKSQDTEMALRVLPPGIAVACVQNGVANERLALRYFADVYGVCVMFPATHLRPGYVTVHSSPVPGLLDLGRYPSGRDDTASTIAAAFREAGFVSQARPDIMRWKYNKLLTNLGNAVQAVCGTGARITDIVRTVRGEGEEVLRSAGIEFASDAEERELRGDRLRVKDVAGQPRAGGSTWQSLARGTGSIEADFLNGEIVLLGRLHGVPTPYNEHARRMANRLAHDHAAAGSVTPEEWLSTVDL